MRSTFLVVLSLVSLKSALGSWAQPTYSADHLEALRTATCTNMDEILNQIDYMDFKSDPYPGLWYDTLIPPELNCYVVWASPSSRAEYRLESLTEEEAEAKNGTGQVYMTHNTPCGACSDLQNLHVYLTVTDLTTPVRQCGFKLIQSNAISCLQDIGFRKACKWIWYWNTKNTKKSSAQGGCLGKCLLYAGADNIQEEKLSVGDNPCSPSECGNTINGGSVCTPDQYEDGPYRLNPCLQCDECRSGPIFQKLAGRTRRGSGIPSAIPRPPNDVFELTHFYGISTNGLTTSAYISIASVAGLAVAALGLGFTYHRRRKTAQTLPIATTTGPVVIPDLDHVSRDNK